MIADGEVDRQGLSHFTGKTQLGAGLAHLHPAIAGNDSSQIVIAFIGDFNVDQIDIVRDREGGNIVALRLEELCISIIGQGHGLISAQNDLDVHVGGRSHFRSGGDVVIPDPLGKVDLLVAVAAKGVGEGDGVDHLAVLPLNEDIVVEVIPVLLQATVGAAGELAVQIAVFTSLAAADTLNTAGQDVAVIVGDVHSGLGVVVTLPVCAICVHSVVADMIQNAVCQSDGLLAVDGIVILVQSDCGQDHEVLGSHAGHILSRTSDKACIADLLSAHGIQSVQIIGTIIQLVKTGQDLHAVTAAGRVAIIIGGQSVAAVPDVNVLLLAVLANNAEVAAGDIVVAGLIVQNEHDLVVVLVLAHFDDNDIGSVIISIAQGIVTVAQSADHIYILDMAELGGGILVAGGDLHNAGTVDHIVDSVSAGDDFNVSIALFLVSGITEIRGAVDITEGGVALLSGDGVVLHVDHVVDITASDIAAVDRQDGAVLRDGGNSGLGGVGHMTTDSVNSTTIQNGRSEIGGCSLGAVQSAVGLVDTAHELQSVPVVVQNAIDLAADEQAAVGAVQIDGINLAGLIIVDLDSVLSARLGLVIPAVQNQLEVVGQIGADECSQIAAAVKEQVIADLAHQVTDGGIIVHILDMLVDLRLRPLGTIGGGSGAGVAVDLIDGSGLHSGLVGLGLAIDDGVVDHIVLGQLIGGDHGLAGQLVEYVAAGVIVFIDQVVVLDIQGDLLIADAGDLCEGVDDLEDVIGLTVTVVVDDLQPVAALVGGDIGGVVLVDVLLQELLEGLLVGDVLLAAGTNIDFTIDVGVTLLVGDVEDLLDIVLVSSTDGIANAELLGVDQVAVIIMVVNAGGAIRQNEPCIPAALDHVVVRIANLELDGDLITDLPVGVPVGALTEVHIGLSIALADASAIQQGGEAHLIGGLVLDVLAAVSQAENGVLVLDVDQAALAQVVQIGAVVDGVGLVALADHGLTGSERVGIVQVGVLVGDDHALDFLQAQLTLAQSLARLGVAAGNESAVLDGLAQQAAEEDLGNHLTGSGSAEVAADDVLQDALALGDGGGLELPTLGIRELTGLAIAQGAEQHDHQLIAGHLSAGVEGGSGGTDHDAGVLAVVDVTLRPVVAVQVGELALLHIGVVVEVLVLDIAGSDAVDKHRSLSTVQSVGGLEGTIFKALENFELIQDFDGGSVGVFRIDIREARGAGGSHEGQTHDEGQHQCENLLQISHGGFFLLQIF